MNASSSKIKVAPTKREKHIANCKHYKNILRKWESAVEKTEGRKPGKADLKNAPETIQKAYKQYYKLIRYLESNSHKSVTASPVNKSKGFSPQKIFGQKISKVRESFSNSSSQNSIARSSSATNLQKFSNYSRFALKVSSAVSLLLKSKSPVKPHSVVKVVEESGQEVIRKALIPNRFLKKTNENADFQTNGTNEGNDSKIFSSDSSGNSSMLMDESVEPIPNMNINVPVPVNQCSSKLNSVSAIWQNLSPNPKSKSNRKSNKSEPLPLKHVNPAWLERCGVESENSKLEINKSENSDNDKDNEDNVTKVNISLQLNGFDSEDEEISEKTSESLFAPEFQNFLLSAESKTPLEHSSLPSVVSSVCLDLESSSCDSGIGINTFNAPPPPPLGESGPPLTNYFNEGDGAELKGTSKKKGYRNRKQRLTGKAALESKISAGKVNENFVRIDITKKVFVRGHKKISGAKCKRNDWKLKKATASKEEQMQKLICRKCGESGHFAKFCKKDSLAKEDAEEVDDSPFPTLEEAARMLKDPKVNETGSSNIRTNIYNSSQSNVVTESDNILDSLVESNELNSTEFDQELSAAACEVESTCISQTTANTLNIPSVPPYFESGSILSSQGEEKILQDALVSFGYTEYRPGQKEAITRVLKGLSTLVILSTGTGKSLCYQLPAYLYAMKNPGALAICVSPLVSLMEDQVQGIPPFLQAACIHSNMPASQKEKVLERIRAKKLHVLLVSPEAVCGGLFGLLRSVSDLPQISFACIDEVHCLSQWSHNFRPCYLQLSKILRERLNVKTILGLTATATNHTAISVCEHLQIDSSTTVRGEIFPKNLYLSVSRDTHRDEAILNLLRGERFKECESIIIYCTRREECERLSALIRTSLQDYGGRINKINSRQRVSTTCECYHAGMSAGRRRLVQNQFMSGKIRIVVATVAFGMGIDKSDIRSVIHYNMPKTFESYVQEIGRAGRDGLPAHCHLFLENIKGKDLYELRRHVYANSVDRPTLRKLIRKVFQSCKCARLAELFSNGGIEYKQKIGKRCPGHEISFSVSETVEELDLAQENITTLLCYLELDQSRKWIEMLPHTYETCKIHSYGGANLLKASAKKCPPLAAAIALKKEKKEFKDTDTYLEFNVIEVSATLGWNSGIVKREIKNLEWAGTNFDDKGNSTKFRKSGILVEFCNLAFHLNAPGDLTDEEADIVLNCLHQHNVEQEKSQLYQLNRVYQALLSVSCLNVDAISDGHDVTKSDLLKKFICEYFTQSSMKVPEDWKNDAPQEEAKEDEIRRNIRDLLASCRDDKFTGRAVAKIFQGIPSPCYPVETWGRNRAFWRKHIDADFNYLCQIAGQEILKY